MARRRDKQIRLQMAHTDPFDAVPVIAEGVEVREDSQGALQIQKVVPNARGIRAFFSRRFGLRRHLRVNLDQDGSAFWRQIDGRRSLRDIETFVRQRTKREQHESERITILFTKMLMTRHLICLMTPLHKHGE